MATSTLEVIIRGRDLLTPAVRQAQASLSGLGKTADGLKGSIVTGLGLGAGVAGFGLVTAAVSRTIEVLGDATRAAIEEEASVRKLTTTLRENVPAWDGSLSAIEAFTKAGQKLAFTDDAIREAVGKLTVSTGNVAKALDLTRLSMDLARLKGIDLATATDYVNKALGGQIGALRRVLPFIDANATATEALAAIQQAAQGQAESYAQTTAGRLTQAQISLDETLERLGTITMPLVADAASAMADGLEASVPVIDAVASAVGALADGIGLAIDGYGRLAAATTVSKNPARDFFAITQQNDLASRDFATALRIATENASVYTGQLHYIRVEGGAAATSVRDLAAAQKAQAAQALIAAWNSTAAGNAYWELAIRADMAAERTDMLRKTEDGAAYSATVAATGAWTQVSAFEALNKGLERAGMGISATDERAKKFTTTLHGTTSATSRLSDAVRESLARSYDSFREKALGALDAIHDKKLRAIQDAHDLRDAELDAQEAAIRGAVDAERARIDAARDARRKRELVDALQAAQAGGDPEAIRRAAQALRDFLDDQRLDQMEKDAAAKIAAIEAEKDKNDQITKDATEAENTRYANQKKALEADLKLLETHLQKVDKTYQQRITSMVTTLRKYGIDFESLGAEMGEKYATGLIASLDNLIPAIASKVSKLLGQSAPKTAPVGGVGLGKAGEDKTTATMAAEQVKATAPAQPAAPATTAAQAVTPVVIPAPGTAAPGTTTTVVGNEVFTVHTIINLDGKTIAEVVDKYLGRAA